MVATLTALVPVLGAVGRALVGGLIGFLIWIVILVWIYNIARRKGRHALGWADPASSSR